ncbi:MAG TPA: TetR/AcrR family transcriptional regulator [Spirillospora sp.]
MTQVISRQQIIDGAARLFGELGYDGTPLQMIADALGVSTSTIVNVVGDKRTLYIEVMRQAYEVEREALESAVSRAGTGRAAVHEIADAYLDFHVAHRYNRALWAHRWVADAADVSGLEERYARPLFALVGSKIRDMVPKDVGTYYLLGTMVWCVHGFLGSGLFHRSKGVWTADDPEAVESFRNHLHVLMDRLLAPAPGDRLDADADDDPAARPR